MNGDDVRLIREALGAKLGKRLGQQPFGIGFGLSQHNYNAEDAIRRWERNGPTPPAAVALGYLRQGLETALPEFMIATAPDTEDRYLVRLHWPRFVAKFDALAEGPAWSSIEWIDDPMQFGGDRQVIVMNAFINAPIP